MLCHECNRHIPAGDAACSCGWLIPNRSASRPVKDPKHGKCAWSSSYGRRCQYPGALSDGTKGESPFYCGFHFRCDNAIEGDAYVSQSEGWDGDMASYIDLRRQAVGKARRAA